MASDGRSPAKRRTLKEQDALHPRASEVVDELFQNSDFFDPEDVVQVKYEMLRRVHRERHPVKATAARFGFSRASFYKAQANFEQAGLGGLIPRKRGPRSGHKLTEDVLNFVEEEWGRDPGQSGGDIAEKIRERFALEVHPSSIQRALTRREKKRP